MLITARLNDRCQPMHRGMYEDPLDDLLRHRDLGSVDGGGTQLDENGEVAYCEISLDLHSLEPSTLRLVTETLEQLGAPKGSKLIISPESEIPFGKNEGLAFYFDNVNLPAEVYASNDIGDVIEAFRQTLDGFGVLHSYKNGARETAIYVYGPSFREMKAAISKVVHQYPLCEGARMVQCA